MKEGDHYVAPMGNDNTPITLKSNHLESFIYHAEN